MQRLLTLSNHHTGLVEPAHDAQGVVWHSLDGVIGSVWHIFHWHVVGFKPAASEKKNQIFRLLFSVRTQARHMRHTSLAIVFFIWRVTREILAQLTRTTFLANPLRRMLIGWQTVTARSIPAWGHGGKRAWAGAY